MVLGSRPPPHCTLSIDGEVVLRASGAKGGLAGTGIRSRSDRINVSSLMLVNYAELRDGLSFVAGGGWQNVSVLNLPTTIGLPLLIVFEAGGVEQGEYTIGLSARGPDGVGRNRITFPITVVTAGDIVRISSCCNLTTNIDVFGLWQVVVDADDRELATFDVLVKRTAEP